MRCVYICLRYKYCICTRICIYLHMYTHICVCICLYMKHKFMYLLYIEIYIYIYINGSKKLSSLSGRDIGKDAISEIIGNLVRMKTQRSTSREVIIKSLSQKGSTGQILLKTFFRVRPSSRWYIGAQYAANVHKKSSGEPQTSLSWVDFKSVLLKRNIMWAAYIIANFP